MNLKGNSGCKLIVKNNTVEKIADKNYIPRLKAQVEKQMAFQGCVVDGYSISNEPVVAVIDNEDSFSFIMPFDNGKTVAELIKNEKQNHLAEVLLDFLIGNCASVKVDNAKELVDNKLKSLEKTVSQEYVSHIEAFENQLASEIYDIKAGYCHGDFTLENILIDGGSIHLIDFLDSFIESPFLDIATMLQDCRCLWSYRYEALNNTQLENIASFNKVIENKLKDMRIYRQINILLLMKLYRILPYIKDDITAKFLNRNIKAIEEELNLNVSNG